MITSGRAAAGPAIRQGTARRRWPRTW
jgi:hypothetical protein